MQNLRTSQGLHGDILSETGKRLPVTVSYFCSRENRNQVSFITTNCRGYKVWWNQVSFITTNCRGYKVCWNQVSFITTNCRGYLVCWNQVSFITTNCRGYKVCWNQVSFIATNRRGYSIYAEIRYSLWPQPLKRLWSHQSYT
jgi:hypothetical protein